MTNTLAHDAPQCPWPTLAPGGYTFPTGSYTVDINPRRNSSANALPAVKVRHRLQGAGLLSRLLAEGFASYATVIEERLSAYRQVHRTAETEHSCEYDGTQMYGEPKLQGRVLAVTDILGVTPTEDDNVDPIWVGREVNIPQGAILAMTDIMDAGSLASNGMLHIIRDENWGAKPGEIRVTENADDGFQWHVRVKPSLADIIAEGNRQDPRWQPTMIGLVTACLSHLAQKHGRDDGEGHPGLERLGEELEEKQLPHWTSPDFDAALVATALYPYSDCPLDPTKRT